MELRNASFGSIKVKYKDFGQLLDTEWPNGKCKAMEKSAGIFLVVFVDILQHAIICFVQRLWQLLEDTSYIWLGCAPQGVELTENPLKPT